MPKSIARRALISMAATLPFVVSTASADDVMDARHIIDESAITVERVRQGQKSTENMDEFLRQSKGVLVIPNYYKASFILGGSYGDGVLLKRQSETTFGDPSFYRMTAGSIGLQAGMDSAEIVHDFDRQGLGCGPQ
jgi:lipid-binding SYLF domain-containing protein